MSNVFDMFSKQPPGSMCKQVIVTLNNKDTYHRIKVGNIFENQWVIISMTLVANDSLARTYKLELRKL